MINDSTAKAAKPRDKKYLITDVRGLYLEVMPSGKKYWRFRCKNPNGKRSWFTLGEYPEVSIKRAREQMPELRKRAEQGRPLSDGPKLDMMFSSIAEAWAKEKRSAVSDKTTDRIRVLLDRRILPVSGDMDITSIKPKDVLAAMQPLVDEGKSNTAVLVKDFISQIFRFAAARGVPVYDPCSVLRGTVLRPTAKHFATVTDPKQIGELLRRVNAIEDMTTRLAATWLIYSMCRTGEMRSAEWCEIDLRKKEWRLPPTRMKNGRPHIVPLSDQLLAVLKAMKKINKDSRYIFPRFTHDGEEKILHHGTISTALHRLGYASDEITPHGFRSMASTTLNENGFNSDWIERQLSHVERNRSRAAYNYADYLDDRRKMLQWYADHLDRSRGAPINYE